MKDLANKIANIIKKDSKDPVVIAIATAWVNMVSYLIKNTGLTHKEADSMVYDIFKNDQERFADFCKIYYN